MTIADGNEPRFDIDLAYGRQGELWVANIVEALRTERVEVKTDDQFARTGNLYVEHASLNRHGWEDSGIAVSESPVWVFKLGTSGIAIVVEREVLRDVCEASGRYKEQTRGSNPTKGRVIPAAALLGWARQRVSGEP